MNHHVSAFEKFKINGNDMMELLTQTKRKKLHQKVIQTFLIRLLAEEKRRINKDWWIALSKGCNQSYDSNLLSKIESILL